MVSITGYPHKAQLVLSIKTAVNARLSCCFSGGMFAYGRRVDMHETADLYYNKTIHSLIPKQKRFEGKDPVYRKTSRIPAPRRRVEIRALICTDFMNIDAKKLAR